MNEEKIYQFNDYVLSYDKSLSDRSCLTISKIQNSEMYLMGELFDDSADVVSMILDSLQTTVNYCKQENARLKGKIDKVTKLIEEIKLHYQQSPTMIPNVKINKLEDLLKEN